MDYSFSKVKVTAVMRAICYGRIACASHSVPPVKAGSVPYSVIFYIFIGLWNFHSIPASAKETGKEPMAIKPPPPPWEVLQQVGELVGGQAVKEEVDKGVRALAQSALGRLDVVSREEFDAQAEILARTRAQVAALEKELEAMTEAVEALSSN